MTTSKKSISVIIASYNRRELLRRCLDALCRQSHPAEDFEVIVADDGSTDGTSEMLTELETPFRLHVLSLQNGGKSAASNAAIDVCDGDVCLFLDDDVIASPQLVAEHLAAHRRDPSALGIGKLVQEPPKARDWYAHAYAENWNRRYEELAERTPVWTDCYGGNFSAPREKLVDVGGFSTEIPATVDIELGFRLCEAGCTPIYLPQADAVHDDDKRRKRMLEHLQRHGRLMVDFIEKHPKTEDELLGWFLEATAHETILRRLMLAVRLSPNAIAVAAGAVPSRSWRRLWAGFISRYAIWLGVRTSVDRKRWRQITAGVPVLMYHAFAADGEPGERYVMPKKAFDRQLRLLAALRYRVISVEQLAEAIRSGGELPRRAVAITIDDGYRDNLDVAAPILRRRRLPATVYLVSERIGGTSDWTSRGPAAERPLLSYEEITAMQGDHILFGAHTRTHPSLPALPDEAVTAEVVGSRKDLEERLGEVRTFAYPYGRFDERAVAAAAEAGYAAAFTTRARPARRADNPLLIPRIEIKGTDPLKTFLRKLWFGGT